jgi:hypothetical protein
MKFDLTKWNIVYPSWVKYSYQWDVLPMLLYDPLETRYLRRYTYDWAKLGYSMVTDNFKLIPGIYGNGIIRYDRSSMTKEQKEDWKWLPNILLGAEARQMGPPGISGFESYKYCVSYLSPKPSDDVKLGFEKQKDDPMPYFSVEPMAGMEDLAYVCFGVSGTKKMPEDFRQFVFCLKSFGLEGELLETVAPDNSELVDVFLKKWNLTGFWFFVSVNTPDMDAGLFLAILTYLGSHFRSLNPRLKSVHMMTTLDSAYEAMCSKWTMQKLR